MPKATCSVDDCGKPAHARTWCRMHLYRFYKFGSLVLPIKQHPPCAWPGCDVGVPKDGGRKLCPAHRRRTPTKQEGECVVAGCQLPQSSRNMCVMHYTRQLRTGTTDLRPRQPIQRYRHTAGYVLIYDATHPLRDRHNYVYEHRAVLMAKVGSGSQACHHCGCVVTWGVDLETDHLDYDRANNDPSNLVPSCHTCNTRRARHRNQYSPVA